MPRISASVRTQSYGDSNEKKFVLFLTHYIPGPLEPQRQFFHLAAKSKFHVSRALKTQGWLDAQLSFVSHSCAVFPFPVLTNLGQDKAECSSRINYIISSQGSSLPLTLPLCSIGQKHKEEMGKELEAALRLEEQSSILNTNIPIVYQTLGGYPS